MLIKEILSLNELEYQTGYTSDPRFSSSDDVEPVDAEEEEDQEEETALPAKNRALIVGDSQAEGQIGIEFERQLQTAGFDVFRYHKRSAPGSDVSASLLTPNIKSIRPNLVVAIFGGNDESADTAQDALADIIQTCAENDAFLIAVGPGPAVEITDLIVANKSFPKRNIKTTDYWTSTPEGIEYNKKRNAISDVIDNATGVAGVGLFAFGIYTNHAARLIKVPPQPDGLHIVNGARDIVSKILEMSDYEDDLPDAKPGTPASNVKDMLKQPAYYADLDLADADTDLASRISALKTKATASTFKYQAQVNAAASKYGIPAEMIKAVMGVESTYNPLAIGPETNYGKAAGLMQFVPAAANSYNLKNDPKTSTTDPEKDERFDPDKAIDAGANYLSTLRTRFGNWPQALAGYNGGPYQKPTPLEWAIDGAKTPQTKDYVKKAMILYHELGGEGYL